MSNRSAFSMLFAGLLLAAPLLAAEEVPDPTTGKGASGPGAAEGGPAPVNDFCSAAVPVGVPSLSAGSTVGATIDSEQPFCGTGITSPGVWYEVIGTGNTMTASTCNIANYDTKISVYCAECDTAVCVAGVDDTAGCAGFTTMISWCSTAGETYRILVHGFGGATGNFDLAITDDGVACAGAVSCYVPPNILEIPTVNRTGLAVLALLLAGAAALLLIRRRA